MTIKSVAVANITDLITCVVTSIHNFFSKIVKLLMAQGRRGRRGGIRGNQMNVGEGVEANPPVGRNVGRNQNIEREDMIAELRRQGAALTEVVQHMQPPHETTDESDDSHSHFENPFGAPPRGRPYVERNEPRLDYNFKVEIPEFQTSLTSCGTYGGGAAYAASS